MSGESTGQPYAVELLADIRRALGAGHRPKLSALADIVAGLMAEKEALEKVEQAAREVESIEGLAVRKVFDFTIGTDLEFAQ